VRRGVNLPFLGLGGISWHGVPADMSRKCRVF
jgi:hypothetical protein